MSDCGEAHLGAVGCQENVLPVQHLVGAYELSRDLGNTLRHALAFPPHSVPFHLENRLAPNYLCGLDILDGHIRPRDPPYTFNCSVIHCRGMNQFLVQVSSLYHTCYLLLDEQLHVVLNCLEKSKLTHLHWVADVQTARVHFKQQIRQAKCTAVDNKCCVQLAIIGHPVNLDKVLEVNDVGDGFLAEPG